jgi:hypothetical protein
MSKAEVLSKSIGGTAIKVTTTSVFPIHVLPAQKTRARICLQISNNYETAHVVEIHFNGQMSEITVPAHDSRNFGPFVLHGQAIDGTDLPNKTLSVKTNCADVLFVMGEVSD